MPHLIVLGDGIFEKGLEYEGGAFLNEISTQKSRCRQIPNHLSHHVQSKKAPAMNKEESLPEHDLAGTLILDFPVSRTVTKEVFVVYKLPSVWYVIIAA